MSCPLCETQKLKLIETIKKEDILKLYKKLTSKDLSYLLNRNLKYLECQNCKLRFYDPLITGDENFYNALQKFSWYYMDEKEEYHIAKKYIGENSNVLEVGSGKGAFAKHIATKKYVGLDFSKHAKELAAKNGIKIENQMIHAHAGDHQGSYDVVVSFQVLEHVSDPKGFIEDKIKALKIGGRLIIAVPTENSFLKYLTNAALNMPPHHVTRWSDDTFNFVAKKYNLKIIDLYHEKVQSVHKNLYLTTLLQCLVLKHKMIDLSFKRKLISKVAGLVSRFLNEALVEEMLPNGHTVLVVMEKQ